jgi:hypothetical protein
MAELEAERWIRHPNRWLRPLGMGLFLFGVAVTVFATVAGTKAYGLGSPFIVLGAMASLFGRTVNLWPSQRLARVRANAEGLHVDGALAVPRASIARAYLQPIAGHRPHVRIEAKSSARSVDVVTNDAAEGARVLEALELDAAHRAITFRGASPLFATAGRQVFVAVLFALAMIALPAFGRMLGPSVVAAVPLCILPWLLAVIPSTLSVGADGVLTRWLGFERFHPYDRMEGLMPYNNGVGLVMKSGKTVHVATSPARMRQSPIGAMNRDAVVERIEEARRAFDAHRTSNAAALVARSGRTLDDWLAALRSLAGSADYREAAVPREALWRIAEDPAAEATARAGAAVALRGRMDDADRARLRVAAESSVSPRVRVAFEVAAKAEDERDIVAALEGVEDKAEG